MSIPIRPLVDVCFLLGRSRGGAWMILAPQAGKGGQFPSRREAIDYARHQSKDGNFVIIHCPTGLEWQRLKTGQ